MSLRGARGLAAALAGLAWLGLAGGARAADPFYERLMDSGLLAFARSDYQGAAEDLRLGCFGLLDEPARLAEGLAYLAIAQAEIGDESAFSHTFSRLIEVERRFHAFSGLDLDAEVRGRLDRHLERLIPIEALEREAAFASAARRKRLRELPPDQLRRELERLIAADPGDQTWRVWLAELALSTGDVRAAYDAAERSLARAPGLASARCLRGRAGAALGRCEAALPDLEACDGLDPERLLETRLRCLIELERWHEADALIGRLSDRQLRDAPFKQLARAARKGKRAAPPASDDGPRAPAIDDSREPPPGPASAEAGGSAPGDGPGTVDPVEPAPPSVPPAVLADLERIRERLLQARTRADLSDAFAQARRIADARPRLAEAQLVAAEVAYRLSRWHDAVVYFDRVEDFQPGGPEHRFYYSVALYESGDRAAAREMLELCLPLLERTDFVESYAAKIRDGDG